MVEHKLKIQSEHYINVINGTKTAEIRYNDRNYQVGDILILNEIDENGVFTGNNCVVIVTHVLDDNQYLQTGYVMLSFHMLNSDFLNRGIDEIKAQGIEEAVKKADSETYINLVGKEFPPQQQYRAELLAYASALKIM
jgi:ASCH domain.